MANVIYVKGDTQHTERMLIFQCCEEDTGGPEFYQCLINLGEVGSYQCPKD